MGDIPDTWPVRLFFLMIRAWALLLFLAGAAASALAFWVFQHVVIGIH